MCIVAICKERKMTEKEFKNCFKSHSDGFGVAWNNGTVNKYRKGFMEVEEAWKYYNTYVKTFPHVAHFRTGTSGSEIPELTHPYLVDDVASTDTTFEGKKPLIFQNGVTAQWKSTLLEVCLQKGIEVPDGEWSDTRMLALAVRFLGKNVLPLLDTTSKFVHMSSEGYITVYNMGAFTEQDGIYFSNRDYEDVKTTTYYRSGVNYGWGRRDTRPRTAKPSSQGLKDDEYWAWDGTAGTWTRKKIRGKDTHNGKGGDNGIDDCIDCVNPQYCFQFGRCVYEVIESF